jgi:hypothetical protein
MFNLRFIHKYMLQLQTEFILQKYLTINCIHNILYVEGYRKAQPVNNLSPSDRLTSCPCKKVDSPLKSGISLLAHIGDQSGVVVHKFSSAACGFFIAKCWAVTRWSKLQAYKLKNLLRLFWIFELVHLNIKSTFLVCLPVCMRFKIFSWFVPLEVNKLVIDFFASPISASMACCMRNEREWIVLVLYTNKHNISHLVQENQKMLWTVSYMKEIKAFGAKIKKNVGPIKGCNFVVGWNKRLV